MTLAKGICSAFTIVAILFSIVAGFGGLIVFEGVREESKRAYLAAAVAALLALAGCGLLVYLARLP